MIPDVERVLTAYLAAPLAVLGVTVVDQTPDATDDPWVRLTLLDAPAQQPDHLVAAYLQLDVYAGAESGEDAHEDASLIARTVRGLLESDTIARATHSGATVTGARVDGYLRLPDAEFEPARERYVLTATIWMHG